MSDPQDAMMATAHGATGGALGVIAVLFGLGVALYLWAKPR